MKKSIIRKTAALLAIIMAVSLLAACNSNSDDDDNSVMGSSEYVYVPEFKTLPEGISNIGNMTMIGDKFVLTSYTFDEETYESTMSLYTMSFEGDDLALLENYVPMSLPENAPENAESTTDIMGMFADGEGNIWIAQRANFYYFDLPDDFDEEEDMYGMYAYYQDLGSSTVLRKLDNTGAELDSIDLSDFAEGLDYFYIQAINMDDDGNIYIAVSTTIYVLDDKGNQKFSVDVDNWIDTLVKLPDGDIAHLGWIMDSTTTRGMYRGMRKIDVVTGDWGEQVPLPDNAYNIFPSAGEYALIFSDNNNLYGIDDETGESTLLLNWINSGVGGMSMNNVFMLPNDNVFTLTYSYDYSNMSAGPTYEVIILNKVPVDSVPPRIVLTLACMNIDWTLRSTIVNFNRTNQKYRIFVNDYSVYSTQDDYMAGLTKLSTEIISGEVPDLIITNGLPLNQYISRGLIEDLNPFIDADPGLSRSDLVEGALRAAEVDGKLYQLFSNFYVFSLWGNPAILGDKTSWTMEEFMDVINANPQATSPIGYYMTKSSFLQQAIMLGMDSYIDWGAGTANFDTDDFIKLLEFASTIPDEVDYDFENWVSEEQLISSGEQIMRFGIIYDLLNTMIDKERFGGEVVYKGFPTASGAGNVITMIGSMAMTTSCIDKDGAWEFMREIILGEGQTMGPRMFGFPLEKSKLDAMFEEMMTQEYYTDEDDEEQPVPKAGYYPENGGYTIFNADSFGYRSSSSVVTSVATMGGAMYPRDMGEMIYIYAMTQEQADQIYQLIDSISGVAGGYDENLINIITEGADDYFQGRASAADAARVIQSRVAIYISELS
ncbi:MAG: hypothetical protein FWG88_01985 [Oscillospiraceae bacterium]|nr:hypothetical protein [Oscillospiraceae bacterium]